MSKISSRANVEPLISLTSQVDETISNLHFVVSIFNEVSGPEIVFNNSHLSSDTLFNLNFKIFSFLMQGVDFGPSNFAKIRGIIQIPQSEYYTSAIDLPIRKINKKTGNMTIVPLVLFLIFPNTSLVIFSRITKYIEDFLARKFKDGFDQEPSFTDIAQFISTLYSFLPKMILKGV
ncbi:MAG: hypothetical protein ACTSSG_11865 [Candidatus Heimdallarchaeaceae archaeon]